MVVCDNCKSKVQDNLAYCPTCNKFIGYPNVRSAENATEESALEKRYQHAINEAENNGYLENLINFDSALNNSKAVINVDIDFLHHFITYSLVHKFCNKSIDMLFSLCIMSTWRQSGLRHMKFAFELCKGFFKVCQCPSLPRPIK